MRKYFGLVIGVSRSGCAGTRLGIEAGRSGFLRLAQATGNDLRIGFVPELMPQAHRHSPMRHRAVRIVLGDLEEFLLRLFIPERMQQGNAALKRMLYRSRACSGEVHGAQLRFGEVLVMLMIFVVIGEGIEVEQAHKKSKTENSVHAMTPVEW